MLINQIKNLLDDIENCNDDVEAILKHFELVKLILMNNRDLDSSLVERLVEDELFSEIFYEIKESSKIIVKFVSDYIDYLENDLKGSDFEEEILSNIKKLESLIEEESNKNMKHRELKSIQREIDRKRVNIKALEEQISEYENVNLEVVQEEEDRLKERLKTLTNEKGNLLKKRKKYQELHKKIDAFYSDKEKVSKALKRYRAKVRKTV